MITNILRDKTISNVDRKNWWEVFFYKKRYAANLNRKICYEIRQFQFSI